MIKVLIVEDQIEHQMYLKVIVNSDPAFKYLGIIRNGTEAIVEVQRLQPDVVIMDVGLPDMSGVDCIQQLKPLCPDTKFMICTIHEEDNTIFEALKSGADSYIVKKSKPYQIIDAIKEVYEGETPISSCIASKMLTYFPLSKAEEMQDDEDDEISYKITMRESEILTLLAQGMSYVEIAQRLYISVSTLKWHVHKIYKKLRVKNRTEAINLFYKKNKEM